LKLREDRVAWREVEGQIVALDMDAAEYFAINQTGATIWPLLAAGATRRELAEHLVDTYDVDEPSAARDVEEFLGELSERDLLEAA
jgi:hypothetical protein